ncbi:MAG: recombinase RecA [Deltaproteobacteria bacterium]|nr:recombinase RecA [Deltaproteobacteria bacterium]
MSKSSECLRLIKEAIAHIEKQFGKGSIMRLGESTVIEETPVLSSGSIGVDIALGVGGLPRGRIIEIFGPESSGKTTLALHAIAQVHKQGGMAAFVDAEHALDIRYAKALGVIPENLLVSQPDSGEQALEICESLVRTGALELLVLDSVAALVPRAEMEGDMGDSHMGLQARLMSQAMRKLTGVAHRTGTILIFINQLRQKIGVTFGNPEVTTGGNALKFYSSVRLDIRRIGPIKDGDTVIGNRTRIKVVKNKVAPPFREVELDVLYGKGIWRTGDLIDCALELGVLERSGSWISWQGKQLGQGRERTANTIDQDSELEKILHEAVLAKGFGKIIPTKRNKNEATENESSNSKLSQVATETKAVEQSTQAA